MYQLLHIWVQIVLWLRYLVTFVQVVLNFDQQGNLLVLIEDALKFILELLFLVIIGQLSN